MKIWALLPHEASYMWHWCLNGLQTWQCSLISLNTWHSCLISLKTWHCYIICRNKTIFLLVKQNWIMVPLNIP